MISFGENLKICVIGSSGGLGSAFVRNLEKREGVESIIALSRKKLDFCSSKIEEICKEFHDESMLYDFSLCLKTDNIFPCVWNILNPAIEIEVNELEADTDSTSETDEVYDDFNL